MALNVSAGFDGVRLSTRWSEKRRGDPILNRESGIAGVGIEEWASTDEFALRLIAEGLSAEL